MSAACPRYVKSRKSSFLSVIPCLLMCSSVNLLLLLVLFLFVFCSVEAGLCYVPICNWTNLCLCGCCEWESRVQIRLNSDQADILSPSMRAFLTLTQGAAKESAQPESLWSRWAHKAARPRMQCSLSPSTTSLPANPSTCAFCSCPSKNCTLR